MIKIQIITRKDYYKLNANNFENSKNRNVFDK